MYKRQVLYGIARATCLAANLAIPPSSEIFVDDVEVLKIGQKEAVNVLVGLSGGGVECQYLLGAALVRREVGEACVRATLDAINRRLDVIEEASSSNTSKTCLLYTSRGLSLIKQEVNVLAKPILMKGNEAIAEAAIRAGCRYFFGYPITPQNEIPEYMSWRLPEVGGAFVQAESEVASINMVYGAAGAGGRVLISSSSPGISLMQEGISYIAGAELPCVIVNMARGGPGLGGIQPSQSDYFQATKGGGHGDYRLLVYGPSTCLLYTSRCV